MKTSRFLLAAALFSALTIWLGWFVRRDDFGQLAAGWLAFSLLYIMVWKNGAACETGNRWLWLGIFLRSLLLFSIPNLSDDCWRFVWDGRLWLAGVHPFSHPPLFFLENLPPGLSSELFEKLNSKPFFTVYPPVCQAVFVAAAWLGKTDLAAVFWMKGFLFACETATIFGIRNSDYGLRIARRESAIRNPQSAIGKSAIRNPQSAIGKSAIRNPQSAIGKSAIRNPQSAILYSMCPLAIFEVVGNVHFEGAMICFLLAGLHFLRREKLGWAALFLSLAVAVKLLPLLFLPVILAWLGWRKSLKFSGLFLVFSLALFAPLLDFEVLRNMAVSLELYFRAFEFNASIYNLLRPAVIWLTGFEHPEWLGPGLATASILGIFGAAALVFFKKISLESGLLAASLIHLFGAATVHPWYILVPFALGIGVGWGRAAVLGWSAMVVLSYSHYLTRPFSENFGLIAVEYLVVFGLLLWGIFGSKGRLPKPASPPPTVSTVGQEPEIYLEKDTQKAGFDKFDPLLHSKHSFFNLIFYDYVQHSRCPQRVCDPRTHRPGRWPFWRK